MYYERLVARLARQWIAGDVLNDALNSSKEANKLGMHAIINYLGEHIDNEYIIKDAVEEYILILDEIYKQRLDASISLKLTQIGLDIDEARGSKIIIMDADFSHPPSVIPTIINELNNNDLVIASRYIKGGKIINWPFKRKLISKCAKLLANYILSIKIRDPLSGFFGFKKNILNNIEFDALGYKLLLEIIVKCNNIKVKEIPYIFINRSFGQSKLSIFVMIDYLRSIIRLYKYGRRSVYGIEEHRRSVLFLSKIGRFYTVGLGGLAVNYIISLLLSSLIGEFYGTLGGILSSITSNFILNKVWTFEDNNFKPKHVFKQYGLYLSISSLGAIVQVSLINILSNLYKLDYPLALLIGVGIASISNFLFNKKFTFKENILG